ncbi:hypothetical protein F5B20DRAFT_112856 [Whalleya microplaca]|nr:hypothetical protein F5B20DRAFT_112856 [Whalleya microplaca]
MADSLKTRARVVCIRCHDRKVRCDLSSRPGDTACRHCQRDRVPCRIYIGARRRRVQSRVAGSDRFAENVSNSPSLDVASSGEHEEASLTNSDPFDTSSATVTAPDREQVTERDLAPLSHASSAPPITALACPGYFGDQSVMSLGPQTQTGCDPATSPFDVDAILKLTRASSIPPATLQNALTDLYTEWLYPYVPILGRKDIDQCGSSLLLRHALSFAGALVQRPGRYPSTWTPRDFANKIKTLLFLETEKNIFNVLKAFCFLSCWSQGSPRDATLDCPWQWLATAIRLAIQLGLHRESIHGNPGVGGCTRQLWWFLFNNETLQSACYGRPSMLQTVHFDVRPPEPHDFDVDDLKAKFFCSTTRMCIILNSHMNRTTTYRSITTQELMSIFASLQQWLEQLPEELRLFDISGSRHPYQFLTQVTHVVYFTSITLAYLLPGPHRQSPLFRKASFLASQTVFRLFEEILYRDEVHHLLPIFIWVILVATVAQVSCCDETSEEQHGVRERIEIGRLILVQLAEKHPSASLVLAKIERLERSDDRASIAQLVNITPDIPSCPPNSEALSTTLEQTELLCTAIGALFPFPESFIPRIDSLKAIPWNSFGAIPSDQGLWSLDTMNWTLDWFDLVGDLLGAPASSLPTAAPSVHS